MFPLLPTLVILLLILLLILHFRSVRELPPGPYNLPLVGYLPLLDAAHPYLTLTRLADRYGPIYGLHLGSVYTVVMSDVKLIRATLARDTTTGRAPLYVTHGIMKGYGLICAEGDLWRDQRKFVGNCLKLFGAQKFGKRRQTLEGVIIKEVDDLISFLNETDGAPLDPMAALRHNVGSFVNTLVFGHSWPRNDETWLWLQHLQEEGVKLIGIAGPLNFLPFLRYIPYFTRSMNFLLEGKHETHKLYRKIIDERDINAISEDNVGNLLDAFLLEREKKKDTPDFDKFYNYDQFYHLLADVFGAGLDTTLTTLRWYLLFLATHPSTQTAIQTELDSVLSVSPTQPLTLDDLPHLPLTEASLLEAQRIRSVVPLGIPHGTTATTTITLDDGKVYRVPQGTMLVPLQWAVHMSEKYWSLPEQFKPERFLNESGKMVKPEGFIPFQTGKRMCIGDDLARMLLFLFGARLVRCFTISVADNEIIDMRGECGITLSPKPCKLIFKKRI